MKISIAAGLVRGRDAVRSAAHLRSASDDSFETKLLKGAVKTQHPFLDIEEWVNLPNLV